MKECKWCPYASVQSYEWKNTFFCRNPRKCRWKEIETEKYCSIVKKKANVKQEKTVRIVLDKEYWRLYNCTCCWNDVQEWDSYCSMCWLRLYF